MTDHPTPARSLARRLVMPGVLLFIVLLIAAGVAAGPYVFERNDYAGTPSIEARGDYRAPALMASAWALPVARRYAARPYQYQSNPSFCGPASIANLLHSLGRSATQDGVLQGTSHRPWFGILIGGLTLDAVGDLLHRRTGRPVTLVRGASLPRFRALMALANDPARRMIVNFHRGPLFGRGHGHHSPVLGYLASRDLVLVGDVNAEYRPFLVPTERLWRAVRTVDSETAKERGLAIVTLR